MLEMIPHPSIIIDWIIVQHFALQVLNVAKKGYTNTYQIKFYTYADSEDDDV